MYRIWRRQFSFIIFSALVIAFLHNKLNKSRRTSPPDLVSPPDFLLRPVVKVLTCPFSTFTNSSLRRQPLLLNGKILAERLRSDGALSFAKPFAFVTFCNLLPSTFFDNLVKTRHTYFPGRDNSLKCQKCSAREHREGLMEYVERTSKSCNQQVVAARNNEYHKPILAFPKSKDNINGVTRKLFLVLARSLRSFDFEYTLFKSLGFQDASTHTFEFFQIRVWQEFQGLPSFHLGRTHTDEPKNITMQLYLPLRYETFDSNSKIYERVLGTCFHSLARGRDASCKSLTPCANFECEYQVAYQSNCGYAFKVGPHSFHSSPDWCIAYCCNISRSSIMINWSGKMVSRG